jgi:hypothetical protein
MIAQWDADGVLGPNGRFYNFKPDDPVGTSSGSGNTQVQPESDHAGINEHVRIVLEDDKSYTVVLKELTSKHGKDVIMSSPNATGSVQTRFREERYADETFTFVEPSPKDAWAPAFVLWCVHTRTADGGAKMTYTPTLFTVVNPKKV